MNALYFSVLSFSSCVSREKFFTFKPAFQYYFLINSYKHIKDTIGFQEKTFKFLTQLPVILKIKKATIYTTSQSYIIVLIICNYKLSTIKMVGKEDFFPFI